MLGCQMVQETALSRMLNVIHVALQEFLCRLQDRLEPFAQCPHKCRPHFHVGKWKTESLGWHFSSMSDCVCWGSTPHGHCRASKRVEALTKGIKERAGNQNHDRHSEHCPRCLVGAQQKNKELARAWLKANSQRCTMRYRASSPLSMMLSKVSPIFSNR